MIAFRRYCAFAAFAVLAAFAGGCSSAKDGGSGASNGDAGSGGGATSGHHPSGAGGDASSDGGSSAEGGGKTGPTFAHGPVTGLVKPGTAEYVTGLLMDDGRIMLESGQVTPVLSEWNPPGTKFVDFAGGLHQIVALDDGGRAWTWGATSTGLQGSGMDGGDATTPYQILTDIDGNDFNNVGSVVGGIEFNGAVKQDGSVWMWGDCVDGFSGDGTDGGVLERPQKVHLPDGVQIKKLLLADIALALAADGSVWSWGGTDQWGWQDDLGRGPSGAKDTPGKLSGLPADIVDIAAGDNNYYALTSDGKLYGWGYSAHRLCVTDDRDTSTPFDLTDVLNLPAKVKAVASNDHTTHVVLEDGSLWGWGDGAMGEVGDGHEIDFGVVGPHSNGMYAWDWGVDDLPVLAPVHIAKDVTNFSKVFTNTSYVFYVFALTDDGHLFSWGRNKTGNLMNGVVSAAPLYGAISAQYPNSWDVTSPENVNPFELEANKEVTSPYCLTHPSGDPCDQFNNQTGKAVYEK